MQVVDVLLATVFSGAVLLFPVQVSLELAQVKE